jgi:hypothetical protein
MTADTAETAKTGPETRAQAISALGDAEVSTGRAESRTAHPSSTRGSAPPAAITRYSLDTDR